MILANANVPSLKYAVICRYGTVPRAVYALVPSKDSANCLAVLARSLGYGNVEVCLTSDYYADKDDPNRGQ